MTQDIKKNSEASEVHGSPEEQRTRISLEALDNPVLVEGLAYWRNLCGGRKFPVRSDVTPRGLKHLSRNTVLLRVIDGGADYEIRIAGDAHVVAHGFSVQGMFWSELSKAGNRHMIERKAHYDAVVRNGEPVAISGLMAADGRESVLLHNTALLLPLGPDEKTVEFLLVFSVYAPNAADSKS